MYYNSDMKTCRFDDKPVVGRGLCNACWKREKKNGTLKNFAGRYGFVEDRWNHHLNKGDPDSCWNWAGPIFNNGYGMWIVGRSLQRGAHIESYNRYVGQVEKGLELDHLCRNRACVNPKHLEPVTKVVNILRGIGPSALNAKKTHCPKGHPYDFVDTAGHRRCRVCRREVQRRHDAKKRSL